MELRLNGDDVDVAPGTTVGALVDGFGTRRAGVVVARNDEVVHRSEWDRTVLRPGDRVEVLSVAQGG